MCDSRHILVVDDDAVSLHIFQKVLGKQYDIKLAHNGEEAISILKEQDGKFSAMIIDLYMPVMDGYSLIDEISNHDEWKNIPVIVVTSETSLESDEKVVNRGISNIVYKPINARIFKKQLENIINTNQRQSEYMKEQHLMRSLYSNTTNGFMCKYSFDSGKFIIRDINNGFFKENLNIAFKKYPFDFKGIVLAEDLEKISKFFECLDEKSDCQTTQVRFCQDGIHFRWYRISLIIEKDQSGMLKHIHMLFMDIEEQVELNNKLTFMATSDLLTHIPNMRTFAEKVYNMLQEYKNEEFLMITLDISQFSMVNKLFSSQEGDKLLKFLAMRIQEQAENYQKSVYCRMTSDIFYVCISKNEDVYNFMDKLQKDFSRYPLKFDLNLKFGIYHIKDNKEPVESMLEHSSYARFESKKNHQIRYRFYDDNLQKQEYFETMVLYEMEGAVKNKEFEVFLQPKYSISNNQIIGSEALVRWKHSQKGYLSPGIFIPIFERNGFITELDYYVNDEVCKMIQGWIKEGKEVYPVSVNVSRYNLYDSELLQRIESLVEKYQVPTNLIEFEITESAFVNERENLSVFTHKLREKGFRVLIDDFGSGYSALNSLKDMEIDVLKIDMQFLPIDSTDVKATTILKAVVEMANNLNLDTIVEGVETMEQVNLLKSLKCDKVQGYYFDKPMTVKAYREKFLE